MKTERFFRTEKLSVGYDGRVLIRDIDISLQRGQILTLIGPNGSGKSTILKSITRQLAAVAGVVYIDERDLASFKGKELAQRLSVVLTERTSPEMMTCGEVVALGRYPYTNYFGALTAQDRAIVADALGKVRALDLKDRDFSAISDGQRQRIMLARAICQQPEVIILDEPTSFLDIRHKIELLDILQQMAQAQRITVIMSLHEIDLAAKVSDLIVCVKGDTISRIGRPEEVFSEEVIAKLYDLPDSAYNILFGSVELARPSGAAHTFVLAGNGTGVAFYRQLQKRGTAFATGILHKNDVDYQVARVLATEVLAAEAFQPISEALLQRGRELLRVCSTVIYCGMQFGELNHANEILFNEAQELGRRIVRKLEELE